MFCRVGQSVSLAFQAAICFIDDPRKIDQLGVTSFCMREFYLHRLYDPRKVAKNNHSNMITDRLLSTLTRKKVSQLVLTDAAAAERIYHAFFFGFRGNSNDD